MDRKVAALLVLAAAALSAQTAPPGDPAKLLQADAHQRTEWASTWLKSDDPRFVAWGAWLARQDRQTTLAPLLVQWMNQRPVDSAAMPNVLDALIELHATVPAEAAQRVYPRYPNQAIILLVFAQESRQSQQALLEIFDHATSDVEWVTVGNVLLQRLPSGFAFRLIDKLTQHLRVSVYDADSRRFGESGDETMTGCLTQGQSRPGWPPSVIYRLSLSSSPLDLPLADGPSKAYYDRIEIESDKLVSGGCERRDRDSSREHYLERLVGSFVVAPQAYPSLVIDWPSRAAPQDKIAVAIAGIRNRFGEAVRQLQKAAQLTPAEAASLHPRLEVVIRDYRSNKSVPLPVLPEVKPAFSKPLL